MNEQVDLLEESAAVYRELMTPEECATIITHPGMYDINVDAGGDPNHITLDQIGFTHVDEHLPPIHIDAAFQLKGPVGYEFLGYRDGQSSAIIGFIPVGQSRDEARLIACRVIGHLYRRLGQGNISDMQIPILIQGWINSELNKQARPDLPTTKPPYFSRN